MRGVVQEAATLAMEGLKADANSTKAASSTCVQVFVQLLLHIKILDTDDSGYSCAAICLHCGTSVFAKIQHSSAPQISP